MSGQDSTGGKGGKKSPRIRVHALGMTDFDRPLADILADMERQFQADVAGDGKRDRETTKPPPKR